MKALGLLICIFLVHQLVAQEQAYTIVVLGSSTAEGRVGPTELDSAWVYRYEHYLHEINDQHQIINLAKGGYTSYKIMPDEFLPPSGSGSAKYPDKERNISKALSFNPDAVIINLPSNDITNSFSLEEFTANLDSVKSMANNAGVLCFITTTQPRNETQFERDQLIHMKDTILNRYKEFSIDFWESIANPDGSINPIYKFANDGIHLNNAGHKLLTERIIEKDILSFFNVLPIHLIYFKPAEISDLGVTLEWKTASEFNNLYFTIERGEDARSFNEVATITTTGNSNNQLVYSYTDNSIREGNWYYRLKQTDIDGNFSYSKIFALFYPFPDPSSILIYPNPTSGEINLRMAAPYSVTITNSVGKKVFDDQKFQKNQINLIHLPKGTYILQSSNSKGRTTSKIILH